MQEFTAKSNNSGVRADIFVAAQYPKFTRSALEALFKQKLVQINGGFAKPAHKVKPGDKVLVDETLLKIDPPKIKLPIIYEDEDVIVIDKPAGVLTHSKGALNLEGTVASFIKPKLNDKKLVGNRAGIVHRLDRATSGIIITAKNAIAQSWLQRQFSLRKAKKTYIAVVEGVPEPDKALIDAPIARNPKKPQTFYVNSGGRTAQTEYKVLSTIEQKGKTYSVLELKPTTGRTHQLRVHLAYISHPILGDSIYGHGGENLHLHALSLEVTLPNKQRSTFTSPPPAYIKDFMTNE